MSTDPFPTTTTIEEPDRGSLCAWIGRSKQLTIFAVNAVVIPGAFAVVIKHEDASGGGLVKQESAAVR